MPAGSRASAACTTGACSSGSKPKPKGGAPQASKTWLPRSPSSGRALLIIGLFVVWILLAVWVYRDAKKRGMEATLWLLVVLLTGFIGLIVYLIVRRDHPIQQPHRRRPQRRAERANRQIFYPLSPFGAVSGGCPFYRLAAQDLRRAPVSSEVWGAGERGGRRRSCLGSRLLRLLGLVCLLLSVFEVLGRAALSRSLLVKALSLLELALAAWGLERLLEEGLGE